MIAKEIIKEIEKYAPLAYQESYDNSGLQVGDINKEIANCIIALDCTERLIDYAIDQNIKMIITHHPLIFGGLKSLTGKNEQERIVLKAIKQDILIYAAHTNLDSTRGGVSYKLAEKLGLQNIKVLDATQGNLKKLVVFCPHTHSDGIREALFNAGAGHIGNYDKCSYNTQGKGSFRALDGSNPFVGKKGEIHYEVEDRIEVLFPAHIEKDVIAAIIKSHPYEEVAYDIYPLTNKNNYVGLGVIGNLKEPMDEQNFFTFLGDIANCKTIRHSELIHKPIKQVAICGGAGSHLIKTAKSMNADIFVTGDVKYHSFSEGEAKMIIADIGHFESEQYTKELIFEIITKKFPNFATYIYQEEQNPVNYFVIK